MKNPEKGQKAHYNLISHQYDETIPKHIVEHLKRKRIELFKSHGLKGEVLDVGCGTGEILKSLPYGVKKNGIDISEGMIAIAKKKVSKGKFYVGSITKLPFEDNKFDFVYTVAVLHHLITPTNVKKTLKEMYRVTRPGGTVVVWDHNPLNPYWKIIMKKSPQDNGEERLVSSSEISKAFNNTKEVSIKRLTFTAEFFPKTFLKVWSKVETMLEKTPFIKNFAAHNVIIVRKNV